MSQRNKRPTLREDPRIAFVSALEAERVFTLIEDECATGREYYHARERILAVETGRVASEYGAEVAKRMAHAILCFDENKMHPRVRKGAWRVHYDYWFVRKNGRLSLMDRIWLYFCHEPFTTGPAPVLLKDVTHD